MALHSSNPSTIPIFDLDEELPVVNVSSNLFALNAFDHLNSVTATLKLPPIAPKPLWGDISASPVQKPATTSISPTPTELGLGTSGGFSWADDPDLPPIPCFDDEPKKDVAQRQIQKGCGGLKDSIWANHGDSSFITVAGSKPKHEIPQQRSDASSKELVNSGRATHSQPRVDKQLPERNFTRELAKYGLWNPESKNNGSLSPRQSPQPPHKTDNRRSRGNAKQSNNSHRGSRHAESKRETSYEGPRLKFDMEAFQREVKKQGLKTLKDSRWADKDETKEDLSSMISGSGVDIEEPKWKAGNGQYGIPGLKVDMEEFQREVKENGLKTLKDSRWAN
ncbi:hypothetical protein F5Y10DRAFT_289453 [Nemania abortiva]|nr:hypothetical protein F5Y10DRAFT_289453 [Nemania abortiva]